MDNSHEKFEESLRNVITSGPLLDIKFYQVNDNFFEFAQEGYWIIDAGIELVFPKGPISVALNSGIEAFVFEINRFEQIYEHTNFFQLDNANIAKLKKYVGLEVVDVKFKNLEFEFVADYRMIVEKEIRNVEMVLQFKDGSILQIACITYILEPNTRPKNFSFDISTELLISTKEVIEI